MSSYRKLHSDRQDIITVPSNGLKINKPLPALPTNQHLLVSNPTSFSSLQPPKLIQNSLRKTSSTGNITSTNLKRSHGTTNLLQEVWWKEDDNIKDMKSFIKKVDISIYNEHDNDKKKKLLKIKELLKNVLDLYLE